MSASQGRRKDESAKGSLKRAAISGLALTVPLVVTVLVLVFVWGFLASLISPISSSIARVLGITGRNQEYVLMALTTVGLAAIIVIVGLIANATRGSGVEDAVDDAIGALPGIGAVYSSFNEMSEMLLKSDTQSFQEVVMVEYPTEGSYCVAFLTADTPEFVADAVGEGEMVSLFMPMGPNPFMGGFPLHVAADRVYEIDMTVEEGVRSIVTSGVAMGQDEDGSAIENVPTEGA